MVDRAIPKVQHVYIYNIEVDKIKRKLIYILYMYEGRLDSKTATYTLRVFLLNRIRFLKTIFYNAAKAFCARSIKQSISFHTSCSFKNSVKYPTISGSRDK